MDMQHWQQSSYEPYLPVTEKSNPITRDIDRANPKEIVEMLQKCDAEIFERTSYGNTIYQTLNSSSVVQTLVDVSKRVEVILKDPEDSLIVLSGCGTSGRVAFLLATSLNRLLASQNHKPIYSYIIAGGDKALLTSQETPEDDPLLGALSLDKAPFVAGQLDVCLRNLEIFTPVLIGFNPIDMASGILYSLNMFEKVHQITYSQTSELAVLVQKAAISLRRKGHVYYLGWHTLGIIGIIDASECIPTFGAGFEDIRGFVSNGFSEMNNKEGDLSSLGPHFIIDHKDFVDSILPNLNESDTVIFLYSENDDLNEVSVLAESVRHHTSNVHAITHEFKGLSDPERMRSLFMTVLTYKWPSSLYMHQPVLMKQCWELSTKWCLNAISTGAHILIGKVYMNYMIDLRVTNSKLYRRAIHMLQRFTSSTQSQCETALLRAIYDVEELSDEMSLTDVTQHTLVANKRGSVVPIALVMLQSRRTIAETKSYLDAYSVIRDAVAACQRWYFENISSRTEAKRCLLRAENSDGAFLVWKSKENNSYYLSVKNEGVARHYRIKERESDKWFYLVTRKAFRTLSDLVQSYSKNQDGLCACLNLPCIMLDKPSLPSLSFEDHWEIDRSSLTKVKKLGSGEFGEVWHGVWNNMIDVAIKEFRVISPDIHTEINIMKELQHKNLIRLYAVCTAHEPFCIITELIKNGSLKKYLIGHKDIEFTLMMDFAVQITEGMAYLESKNIVHRDLRADNILLTEMLSCKIADFGLAQFTFSQDQQLSSVKVPVKWMAPEIFSGKDYTKKCDVWSFGILLTEIVTYGNDPYPDHDKAACIQAIQKGYRMTRPADCPETLYDIMLLCWHSNPDERPTFTELQKRLMALIPEPTVVLD
ncbi:hypothetical protein QTP86_034442 [Hemibagrus guttatus]|nr:hypothetical protein QTP86_034442 [Hemibagrus guttatus]